MHSLHTVSRPQSLWPYVQIARVDHWFKNAFMLLGVLLAFFYEPTLFTWASVLAAQSCRAGDVLDCFQQLCAQ